MKICCSMLGIEEHFEKRGRTFADYDRDARPSQAINKTKILNFTGENILKRESQSSLLKLQISLTIAKYL